MQARRAQLEDPLRAAQVLQPVAAQISQRCARRQPVPHQRSRRLRHQHLPPVRGRGHPGGPMHLQAHQPGSRPRRLPAMDAHPHPHPLPARPRMSRDGLLHLQHRRQAPPRRGEHREERIPLRVHLAAVVRGQRRPDQRMMTGQHLRVIVVPQAPQQRRRALNVSEQEREGLHPSSVEGRARPRHCQQARHQARPAHPDGPRLLTGLAGHPHGGHRSVTPRYARMGNPGGAPAAKRPRSDRPARSRRSGSAEVSVEGSLANSRPPSRPVAELGSLVVVGTSGITQRTQLWPGRRSEGVPAEHVDVLVAERGQPGGVLVGDRVAGGPQRRDGGVDVAGVPESIRG